MKKMGRYQLTSTLHRADGATVYRAYDPIFECDVAIKVIMLNGLSHHAEQIHQEVEAEANLIMSLEHPGIVRLYGVRLEEDQLYFVMPYLSGGTLAERIQKQPLSFTEVIQLMGQVAPALEFAHAQGLIHRNLKPSNVLFDEQGKPYLSDFACPTLQSHLNFSHPISSAYISPELACYTDTIDQRSDIYALGVMLFEMLTGTLPYQADQPLDLAYKHLYNPIPTASTFQANLPANCDQIIKRAMAKTASARYSTVSELNDALNAIITARQAAIFYPSIPLILGPTHLLQQTDPTTDDDQGIQPSTLSLNGSNTVAADELKDEPIPSRKHNQLFITLRTWPALATLSLLLAIFALLWLNAEYIFGIMVRSYLP